MEKSLIVGLGLAATFWSSVVFQVAYRGNALMPTLIFGAWHMLVAGWVRYKCECGKKNDGIH